MKRLLANQEGVALVTSLCMTLISLTIVMAVMYMVSRNIEQAGASKRYKTALEASYGGTDMVIKDILPYILSDFNSAKLNTDLESRYSGVSLAVTATAACLQDKATKGTKDWDPACSSGLTPTSGPDMTMQLQASGGQPYTVYTKIVDTVSGNTDMTGLQLEGAGVAETLSVITPQHVPYVYRLEVQAQRSANAAEQANMSVMYAY
ncbi:hypothetical protein [Geobacter sp. SVR]|uniref:hypothetical protein n=1 Tax=Geobacter sp. SVR TaxID=2495594 RepID=UPI00143EF7B1|nr:hypothetical protein [Geobacter sp. SVR]BCS53486.1 type IV pilus minor pilin PilX [Geobacter sp. SVR]GCF85387.1 type IV pilus minor pilin PilX [Geobacter sp. SVR]